VTRSAILRVQCPDSKGLDATLAEFIFRASGNILHFEQHMVPELGLYLARIEWDLAGFQIEMQDFPHHFAPIADRLNMKWQIALSSDRLRVAVFVSGVRDSAPHQQPSRRETPCGFLRRSFSRDRSEQGE
jgi:formyltetrahydrofolate deformylase